MSLQFKDEASFAAWQRRNLATSTPPEPAPPAITPIPAQAAASPEVTAATARQGDAVTRSHLAWQQGVTARLAMLPKLYKLLWVVLLVQAVLVWIGLATLGRLP